MYSKKLYAFLGVVGVVILILIAMILHTRENKKNALLYFSKIPKITLVNIDGRSVELQNQFKNQPTCIIYIDIGCSYCTEQIRDIEKKISMLEDFSIIVISPTSVDIAKNFVKQFDILSQQKLPFLLDDDFIINAKLKGASTPFLVFYDARGQFISSNSGFVKTETIKKVLLD